MKNLLVVSVFLYLSCTHYIFCNSIRILDTNSSSTDTGASISTITPSNPQDDPSTNVTKSDIVPITPGIVINNSLIINKTEDVVYEDKLLVNIYTSKLTKDQREEYLFWVKYKNSFNTNAGQLAKMTKYFAPEDPEYYTMVFTSGWPFYAMGALFAFALLIYLVFRFLFKKFLGPKSHITTFFAVFSWTLIIVGFSVCIFGFAKSLSNSVTVHSSINDVSNHIKTNSENLKSTVDKMSLDQNLLKNLNYTSNLVDYTTSVYKFAEIKNETIIASGKTQFFADFSHDAEVDRFNYQIACIVLIPVLTIVSLIFYKLKKSPMVLLTSIILFALIIPALVILGLNLAYFLFSIDLCKDVNGYISSHTKPYMNRGIGVYISCPSKTAQVMINTAKYELGNSFNEIIERINKTIVSKYPFDIYGLGIYRRNNTHFKYLADNKYKNETDIVTGLYAIYYTNNILQGLDALSVCQCADDSINYLEEKFCYGNITLMFSNLIYYFLGTFGLFLLSIGLNKLIVLLNPAYQKMNTSGMQLLSEMGTN